VDCVVLPAQEADVTELASLHAESWRSAYRGLLPDAYLDGPVLPDRLDYWRTRMRDAASPHQLILKAVVDTAIAGFVCVLLDSEPTWGPHLTNLHVKPALKGRGVGRRLFDAARSWAAQAAPGQPMHLWVIEKNWPARRFYERQGGAAADTRVFELGGAQVPEVRYVWQAR
jgi:GNAT superfamily N-acetyltransferase